MMIPSIFIIILSFFGTIFYSAILTYAKCFMEQWDELWASLLLWQVLFQPRLISHWGHTFLVENDRSWKFSFCMSFSNLKSFLFFFIVSCSFLKFGTPSFILKSNLKTAVLIILLWEAHICHVCWLLAVGTCSFKFCDLWLQALVICENPVWPELRMHLYKEAFWFFQPGPQG